MGSFLYKTHAGICARALLDNINPEVQYLAYLSSVSDAAYFIYSLSTIASVSCTYSCIVYHLCL